MACGDWGSDLCTGGTPSAKSAAGSYPASRAFDDVEATEWRSDGGSPDQWLQYDFGSGVSWQIEKVRIRTGNANQPWLFDIRGSNDGVDFSAVLNYEDSSYGANTWYEYIFDNDTAYRYIRIYFGGGYNVYITEIECYECVAEYPEASANDLAVIGESISAELEFTGELAHGEDLAVSESLSVQLFQAWLEASGGDDLGVSESIAAELEEVIVPAASDLAVIGESRAAVLQHNPVADDGLQVVEFLRVALAIPPNWIAWANRGLTIERYYFTITGAPDSTTDIEIPFESFQAQKRYAYNTYISVVVRNYPAYADAIADRPNGEMVLEMAYEYAGQQSIRQEIFRANVDTIDIYDGGVNRSIVINGYKDVSFIAKSVTIENPVFKSIVGGNITYRFAKGDPGVNPGDTVTVLGDTFTAESVFMMTSEAGTVMEVKEGSIA